MQHAVSLTGCLSSFPLSWSFVSMLSSPWLFRTWLGPERLNLPNDRVHVYRTEGLRVDYTSASLRRIGTALPPDERPEAIVFAVWAKDERPAARLIDLPWSRDMLRSLRLRDDELRNTAEPTPVDEQVIADYGTLFARPSNIPRNGAVIFELPVGSTYRDLTGLRAVVALAVRVPIQPTKGPSFVGDLNLDGL